MKRARDFTSKLDASCTLTAHRFKPARSQSEFDDDVALTYLDSDHAALSMCCICAAVCLPSDKALCSLGHLQAHMRCLRALLAPASIPAYFFRNGQSDKFSCWSDNANGVEHFVPEMLQAAAEPSAVFRICSARLQRRGTSPSEPLVIPDNFAEAAAILREDERPWPSFPFMSALEAALYGCEILLQPCPDAKMRLFFNGGLLDSAEFSCIGEITLPPMKCASLGCKNHCDFNNFFRLGWMIHARAHSLEDGVGLTCTCAAHAFCSLPPTFPRLVLPSPPRADVDFPTVALYQCVQDASEGRCGVCLSSASTSNDALLLCAGCGVACHQSCCDTNEVPAGNWYCHVCGSGLRRERHRCCVCPVAFGVLQYAAPPELFIHASCASAMLGTRPSSLTPVRVHIAAANSDSQSNPCCGCGSRQGLRISCRGRGCMLAAHPVCALAQGWLQQPHSKWLCAVHNDNPRMPRDSAFEHKVGGVDGASRIIMSISDNAAMPDLLIDDIPDGVINNKTPSDPDLFDDFGSQGVHRPVNWTEVGALPYRAPIITFPTTFSVIDAIFKLVQFPPSDVMNRDFFTRCQNSIPAISPSTACNVSFDSPDTSWTSEEDRELLRAIQDVGTFSWSAVAKCLSSGRSRKQCKMRWSHLVHSRESTLHSGIMDEDFLLASSRSCDIPFSFDTASPRCATQSLWNTSTRNPRLPLSSAKSCIYTCHLTPMQRFAVVVFAMMAQRQLQSTGLVTQIAWDCILNAFNSVMDAFSDCHDSTSVQSDNCFVARSSLSGSLAVLSWLHRRACTGGGGSSRFIVVIGNTFFNSGKSAPTAACMRSLTSAFSSLEFNRNPIPLVTVTLDRINEVVISKSDAIVVLHGDRSGVTHAEKCILRAAPREYNQIVSHIVPVVGLADVLGLNSTMQSVTVHQCAAVASCLLAAALRGVHVFEIPSFLSRPESVQDAIMTSASATAHLIEAMINQFKNDKGDLDLDTEENLLSESFDDSFDIECKPSKQAVLIDAQTPAAAACRVCFCIATNGSLPVTSSVVETRAIVSRTINAALIAWKCSCDSLSSWLLKASEVDLFWKRTSQHAVSMMRHPGLQADMALCRFGDQARRVDNVSVESLGVFLTSGEDDSTWTPPFPIGAGGRIVRSFWDSATGRHRCLWVTECLFDHNGAVFLCYGRSGIHEMFVGSSAADAWMHARNRILASCKDGNTLIDMTCDVDHWLQFRDSRILAEARFISFSEISYHRSTSKFSYARSPGFVFAPIPPIESLAVDALPSPSSFHRVLFPAATRRGVVLLDLNENGYIDVKMVNQNARRIPISLDDGVIIQSLGYYSITYAAAGGFVNGPNAFAPLLNFQSMRSIRLNDSDSSEFVNSIVIEAGNLVYRIRAKSGFHNLDFFGRSEVDAFNALLQHRTFGSALRAFSSNASVWFGTSSSVMMAAREFAARAADAAVVSISAGNTPGSGAFVRSLPLEESSSQSGSNCVKAAHGVNHSLSGIKYKAVNHSRGRQVDSDAVVFAQSKGSLAVIQHSPSSRFPSSSVIRRGPSVLLPNSSVLLQLDRLHFSPAFKLTVHDNPPVVYVGDSASSVMGLYFQSVAKCRSCQVADLMKAVQHWTGESAGFLSLNAARASSKHIVFQAPDIIDVDASFMYKLPDQGVCSVDGEIRVTILSFGMGRVSSSYASGLHGPLPGFCSVTIDQEGRAYVYICQDDDVHWMHMLENVDGPAVLSFFARSFDSIQWIVRNSSIEIPSEDLFGFQRARQKYLVPLTTQVSLESDDFVDHDFYPPSERDLDFGMALFDIQDETSQTNLSDRLHTSLNSSYPHIGEQFEVSGCMCSSTFQIQSAGVILKGQKMVYVNGLPISHGFHSTGTFVFLNGRKTVFKCTTVYTSSHGNAMIKLALGGDGIVLRFTEKTFSPFSLFNYLGIASAVTNSASITGGDLMINLVGLSHVFSHRRVLGAMELVMPSYVVSVIKSVPSSSDLPNKEIDLDMYLSSPHYCDGITVERWGSARQDLIMDGLIVPVGFQSVRTLSDGRQVLCQVEANVNSEQNPDVVSAVFSVSHVCAGGAVTRRCVASSPQEAWFAFLGLDFNGCLDRFLQRCGYNRCNGMVLFGLGVSSVQSLIHFMCKSSVWGQEAGRNENGFAEEERNDEFVSPFAACEKRQSRMFSAAISRHTQTFLTWLENKRPQPPLKHSVLDDLAPSQQIEHQDAAELWKSVIQRDYGDYKDMVQKDFATAM